MEERETTMMRPLEQTRRGLRSVGKGLAMLAVGLVRLADWSVRRWPYAYVAGVAIAATAVSMGCIGQARAERDALGKRNYELEQRVRRMQTALGMDGKETPDGSPKEVGGR